MVLSEASHWELKQPGPASALSGAVERHDSRVTITPVSFRSGDPVHARIQGTEMECRSFAFLIVSLLPLLAVGNAADSPGRTPIPEPARRTFATEFRRLCARTRSSVHPFSSSTVIETQSSRPSDSRISTPGPRYHAIRHSTGRRSRRP